MVLFPHEPLIGISLINSHFGDDKENLHNLYGVELGLLFFRFSFMRVGSKVS